MHYVLMTSFKDKQECRTCIMKGLGKRDKAHNLCRAIKGNPKCMQIGARADCPLMEIVIPMDYKLNYSISGRVVHEKSNIEEVERKIKPPTE